MFLVNGTNNQNILDFHPDMMVANQVIMMNDYLQNNDSELPPFFGFHSLGQLFGHRGEVLRFVL